MNNKILNKWMLFIYRDNFVVLILIKLKVNFENFLWILYFCFILDEYVIFVI